MLGVNVDLRLKVVVSGIVPSPKNFLSFKNLTSLYKSMRVQKGLYTEVPSRSFLLLPCFIVFFVNCITYHLTAFLTFLTSLSANMCILDCVSFALCPEHAE